MNPRRTAMSEILETIDAKTMVVFPWQTARGKWNIVYTVDGVAGEHRQGPYWYYDVNQELDDIQGYAAVRIQRFERVE